MWDVSWGSEKTNLPLNSEFSCLSFDSWDFRAAPGHTCYFLSGFGILLCGRACFRKVHFHQAHSFLEVVYLILEVLWVFLKITSNIGSFGGPDTCFKSLCKQPEGCDGEEIGELLIGIPPIFFSYLLDIGLSIDPKFRFLLQFLMIMKILILSCK